jgi:hypothetical protein
MRRYPDDDDYYAVVPDRERATPRPKAFICLLRRELAALGSEAAIAEQVEHEEDALPPLDAEEARKRTLAEIIRREGQPAFKTKLVRAYNGCCAVTGCDELGALEAAHIHPYQGPDWNKIQNGLLFRGDINTLFDRHLPASTRRHAWWSCPCGCRESTTALLTARSGGRGTASISGGT